MKRIGAFLLFCLHLQAAEPVGLILPTDNRAIFEGKPEDFYMYLSLIHI